MEEGRRLIWEDSKKLGSLGALMNVCKGTVGTGILGLPWAINYVGIVLGPLLLVAMGLLNLHCMLILVSSAKHLSKVLNTPPLDYGDLAYLCFLHAPILSLRRFAWAAQLFVNVCLQITQLGLCCTYTVFVAQNLRQVIAVHWHDAPDERAFIAMLCIPFVLVSLIPNLSVLAWFSTIANAAGITALILIVVAIVPYLPPVYTREYVHDGTGFAIFLGASIGAYEGIPLILPVANAMEHPNKYPNIIISGVSIIMILYVSVGFVGLLRFGPNICGSITLNLVLGDRFTDTARILYSIAMFLTFPLQFYVAMAIMDSWIEARWNVKKLWVSLLLRVVFVILICTFSISVPYIGELNSLIGATSSAMLVLLLPALLHTMAYSVRVPDTLLTNDDNDDDHSATSHEKESESEETKDFKLPKYVMAKDAVIVLIAAAASIAGLIQTIGGIVREEQLHSIVRRCNGGLGYEYLVHNTSTAVDVISTKKRYILSQAP